MKNHFNNYLKLLRELMSQPCVVGAEDYFFQILKQELQSCGAKVSFHEGILVAEGSQPDTRLISAHIDRHGLICTGPNEFQYASQLVRKKAGLEMKPVSEAAFKNISERFLNEKVTAFSSLSGAFSGAGIVDHARISDDCQNVIFQIKGLQKSLPGTMIRYEDMLLIENGHITGQIDNVLTAAALVYMFRMGYQGTAFFTAQEEAGLSWQYLLKWFNQFGKTQHRLIVLDTSPYANMETADAQGVILRSRDANDHFDPDTLQNLMEICDDLGQPYSIKDKWVDEQNKLKKKISYGSTELGRLITGSKGFVKGTTLQVSTTGYHTSCESTSIESCKAFFEVLTEYALCQKSSLALTC